MDACLYHSRMDTQTHPPLRLITFDLYDTLIELQPTRWDRLGGVLSALAIPHDAARLREGDLIAEDYWTETNTERPNRDRPIEEQRAIRDEYIRRWLQAIDVVVDDATLDEIRSRYRAEYEAQARQAVPGIVDGYRVFEEVIPVMRRLKEAGILRAVISNADDDVTEFCQRLAFADEMDLIVTSATVGWEKPDVRTFRAALDPLGVRPEEALHIGDQARSDVAGALATGMRAALLDRYGRHDPAAHGVPVVGSLTELVDSVLAERSAAPAAATT